MKIEIKNRFTLDVIFSGEFGSISLAVKAALSSGADLSGADLNFSSWPLQCGGVNAKLDVHLSPQLIYHAFNQDHQDADIMAALEPLRELAERFKNEFQRDCPEVRK